MTPEPHWLAHGDMMRTQTLARKLHLGMLRGYPFFPLTQRCHGLENTCDCPDCKSTRVAMVERGFTEAGQLAAPLPPAQPWEQAA